MSSWETGASAGGGGWPAENPSNDARNDWNDTGGFTEQAGDGLNDGNFGGQGDGQHGGVGGDGACRNCSQEGHFARDCTEPRKMGACFNCGEEGHSKAECDKPRQFSGECRTCGEKGHPAADCAKRVIICKNCREEGHETLGCKNTMVIDRTKIPDKTEKEAYAMLKAASDTRDLDDFKEAVEILSKACPDLTYPRLEKECRKREFSVYLIATAKDHGDTITNVNMQGEIEKKYAVGYFFSDKAQRPSMKERWPKSAEENLERLADAGVPMDRGVEKCNNCEKLGHTSRKCPEDKTEVDRPTVKCALCDEEGHRVRDCTQERRKPGAPRTCKVCESEEHMAKDCPNREKRTCRNCGSEDHVAKECDQPRNPATIQCRNCDQMGHTSRDCTAPKDWSRVKCSNCDEMGHTKVRCKQPPKEDENTGGTGFGDHNAGFGGGDTGFGGDNVGFGGGDEAAGNAGASSHNDWEVAAAPVAVGGGW